MTRAELFFDHYPVILQAAGDTSSLGVATLNFSLDTWAFPLLITGVRVLSNAPSLDFDFQIFTDQARTANQKIFEILGANTRIDRNFPFNPVPFRPSKLNNNAAFGDDVATQSPFWCTIINRGATGTYSVTLTYKPQGGPLNNHLQGTIPGAVPLTNGV